MTVASRVAAAYSSESGLALVDVLELREAKCGTCKGYTEVLLGHTPTGYHSEAEPVYGRCPTCAGRGVVPEGMDCPDEAEAVENLMFDNDDHLYAERGCDI